MTKYSPELQQIAREWILCVAGDCNGAPDDLAECVQDAIVTVRWEK